jgi:hypothetical protein
MIRTSPVTIVALLVGLSWPAFAEQEIPVPGELDSYGKIRVEGPLWGDVMAELGFCGTQEVAFESAERGQCTERVTSIEVNDTYRLMAGTYTLRIGSIVYPEPIVIKKNERRVIKMTKVKIPNVEGTVDFKMYYDVRSENALLAHGAALWSFSSMKGLEKTKKIWNKLETVNPEYFEAGSPAALYKALVVADDYGDHRLAFAESIDEHGKQARFQASYGSESYRIVEVKESGFTLAAFYVTQGTDGQSLYLFPGTYRVFFTKDGVTRETGGIVVREPSDDNPQSLRVLAPVF